MKKHTTSTAIPTVCVEGRGAGEHVGELSQRFCLAAGLETLSEMLEQDATAACGERHERGERRLGRTAGGGPKAKSAFTVARSRSSAHGFAGSTGPSAYCRVGRTPSAKTCSATGR